MPDKAEIGLSSLLEAFAAQSAQVQQAVFCDEDALVAVLDREIEPLITAIVGYKAKTHAAIRQQFQFVSALIRDGAEDKASVMRHVSSLLMLVDRYNGDADTDLSSMALSPR